MALIGILLARLYVPFQVAAAYRARFQNPAEVAFRYERAHPGRAWFPENPLGVLMANGVLTHFDSALADREAAGFPLSAEQFAAGLPPRYDLVACPPVTQLNDMEPGSSRALSLLRTADPVVEPGLPGWRVYRVHSTEP